MSAKNRRGTSRTFTAKTKKRGGPNIQAREAQLLHWRTQGLTIDQIMNRTGLKRSTILVTISKARAKTRELSKTVSHDGDVIGIISENPPVIVPQVTRPESFAAPSYAIA